MQTASIYASATSSEITVGTPVVNHLRQVLLWPLRVVPVPGSSKAPWEVLRDLSEAENTTSQWREVLDEYTGSHDGFHERHYQEFTAFLPYVQRFLYGEGRARRRGDDSGTGSPMRVFRRHDIAKVRVKLKPGEAPLLLDIVHVDLYFFFDVDLVLLNLEVSANDLPLPQAQELIYRFGRAYPGGWTPEGHAQHCPESVEWLAADGSVLATSDAQHRELFLAHVAEHRAPRISAHWAHMLEPFVSDHSSEAGLLRFRQIEYYRMPMMAYLGVDNPRSLTREDFAQLAFVTAPADKKLLFAGSHTQDFEQRYCYDRFWIDGGPAPNTRYLCNGHSLVVVGHASSHFYACRDRGVLAQFRHQHFLLFLIAHFQKASLLMFSDRLVEALRNLHAGSPQSVKQFKRQIRGSFEGFLRFTHRYWFHEISDQAQVKALWHMCSRHLELDPLYAEVKERIADMNTYLDADSIRRQANTIVRLTVVTIFGLIGTVCTGFLGMNLIAEADAPLSRKFALFIMALVPTTLLTFYTLAKSRKLSDFLDAVSDDRVSAWTTIKTLFGVWRRDKD